MIRSPQPGTPPILAGPPRRRAWLRAVGGLALAGCGAAWTGCAGLTGPRTLVLGQADIARAIDRRFPVDKRVLEVLDVQLSAPKVTLLPQTNRLSTTFDVRASDRLFGRAASGRLGLDCALRFEPSDGSVRLTQVRVNEFVIDQLGPSVRLSTQRLGALLAEHLLDDASIWQLRPDQMAMLGRAGTTATAVTVTARGVEVTLAPAT